MAKILLVVSVVLLGTQHDRLILQLAGRDGSAIHRLNLHHHRMATARPLQDRAYDTGLVQSWIVGSIIIPIAGVKHGFVELSWFFFSVGLIFWLILLVIVLYRMFFHAPIAEKLMPTLFILFAPPAIGLSLHVYWTAADWMPLAGSSTTFHCSCSS